MASTIAIKFIFFLSLLLRMLSSQNHDLQRPLSSLKVLILGYEIFVIIQFAIEKSKGGKINLFVHPANSFKFPFEETELSMARIAVVPTAQIRRFFNQCFVDRRSGLSRNNNFFTVHFML